MFSSYFNPSIRDQELVSLMFSFPQKFCRTVLFFFAPQLLQSPPSRVRCQHTCTGRKQHRGRPSSQCETSAADRKPGNASPETWIRTSEPHGAGKEVVQQHPWIWLNPLHICPKCDPPEPGDHQHDSGWTSRGLPAGSAGSALRNNIWIKGLCGAPPTLSTPVQPVH